MAAMKNPRNDIVFVDHKGSEFGENKNLYPCLYLVILKDRVFACKAISRMNAIDIASMSDNFNDLMERESLSHGRPINKYQLPNMEVIRVRPYHRGWWMGSGDGTVDNDYIYVSLLNGRPTVYKGGSTILDFASSKGMIHKVHVYDCKNELKMNYIV